MQVSVSKNALLTEGRNKGSIAFKHQNISGVLVNFRQPFIAGYLTSAGRRSRMPEGWVQETAP